MCRALLVLCDSCYSCWRRQHQCGVRFFSQHSASSLVQKRRLSTESYSPQDWLLEFHPSLPDQSYQKLPFSSLEAIAIRLEGRLRAPVSPSNNKEYYRFEDSTWDLAVLGGTTQLGRAGTVQTMLLVFMTVLMQCVYVTQLHKAEHFDDVQWNSFVFSCLQFAESV